MSAVTDPFPSGVRLGIVFMVLSAATSAAACVGCLLFIAYSAVRFSDGSRKWSLETHVHYYFLNLLIFDLTASVGGLLNIKWVVDAQVTEGSCCTAQGALKQIGDVGVALTSLTIAIHTMCVIALRWGCPPKTGAVVVVFTWIFVGLLVGVSAVIHRHHNYFGDTQYWCWITGNYPVERIALEYFWLWMSAFLNIVIYIFLALIIKGVLVVENGKIRLLRNHERTTNHYASGIGTQMLYYPVVYIITALPIGIVRFMAFHGDDVPFAATAISSILLSSSGFLNVALFKLTRPRLLPTRDRRLSTQISSFDIPMSPSKTRSPGRCRTHNLRLDDLEMKLSSGEELDSTPWKPSTLDILTLPQTEYPRRIIANDLHAKVDMDCLTT